MTPPSTVFDGTPEPWRVAFQMAWESWTAGSLGIGCVMVNDAGTVVVSGRNRVLEAPFSGPIAGTLLAHAEMDAFAALGLRTAEGLTLYTTVEPCLMCSATSIAMRLTRVAYAAPDPVFEGLSEVLAGHAYAENRAPAREGLDVPLLAAVGGVLPLANRVWSRPGAPPRAEWLAANGPLWNAAVELVTGGTLTALTNRGSPIEEVVETIQPILDRHGAVGPERARPRPR